MKYFLTLGGANMLVDSGCKLTNNILLCTPSKFLAEKDALLPSVKCFCE